MKNRHTWILAGTALSLLMAGPFASAASPSALTSLKPGADVQRPVILAQAAPAAPVDEEEQQPAEAAPPAAAPEAPQPPAAEAAPEPAPAQPEAQAPVDPNPAPEQPAQAEQPAAPAEEPVRAERREERKKAREAAEPAEEAPAQAEQPAAPAENAPAQAQQPAGDKPTRAERREERRKAREAENAAEPAGNSPAQAEQPAAPAEDAPAQAEQPTAPAENAPAQAEQPAAPAESAPAQAEQPAAPAENAPAQAEQPAAPAQNAPAQAAQPPAENAAPVLDSQKEQPAQPAAEGQAAQPAQPAEGQPPAQAEAPAEPTGPIPESDAAAQAIPIPRGEIQSSVAEEGRRIERSAEERRERRRQRREGTEVVKEFEDNRTIIEFNNQVVIESSDQPRIARGAQEVYYEELPRGRTREVVVRGNGVRVVTIRNRYGDVVRRSRIAPDNREYVLYYVPEDQYDRVREWRDPAEELPPLRLTIPVEEYILDAETVRDEDAYYAFLDQPPVEKIERLYSVDEVKRSARIRDTVRRVDLDVINFEFGSASIPESEIAKLDGVAQAIARLLEENPAETFLIEGHTDAVGSDTANLALSDRRAEAVAMALTSVFEIAPENLATQGYGEQYLKVSTEEPERENRRVAIRRITPLVAPVASAD